MIEKAINRILKLAAPSIIEIDGLKYSNQNLTYIGKELEAEPLRFTTLSSLVDYIKESHENVKNVAYLIHVVSPTRVELVSTLDGDRRRERLAIVTAELPNIPFDAWLEQERMLICVQSQFVEDPETDKAAVLKFTGTVTSGTIRDYSDDGVTQKATIRQGVASKAEAIVPSPCLLRPYRTFTEVEQPASLFIFRMKEDRSENIICALFEADGGAWRNEAMKNICKYLKAELKDNGITIIY